MGIKFLDAMDALHEFNPTLALIAWAALVGIVVSLSGILAINVIKAYGDGIKDSWALAQDRPLFWVLGVSATAFVSCILFLFDRHAN